MLFSDLTPLGGKQDGNGVSTSPNAANSQSKASGGASQAADPCSEVDESWLEDILQGLHTGDIPDAISEAEGASAAEDFLALLALPPY